MTAESFTKLSLHEKAERLWDEGYLLETRTSAPHQYFQLHLMRGFYAELACDVESNEIVNIRIIVQDEAMRMYRAFKKAIQ